MECRIENNFLHIKSDIFSRPGATEILEYNFIDFLESFFDAYHLENIEQLKHEWYHLKDEFAACLEISMNLGIFLIS